MTHRHDTYGRISIFLSFKVYKIKCWKTMFPQCIYNSSTILISSSLCQSDTKSLSLFSAYNIVLHWFNDAISDICSDWTGINN